MRFRRIRKSRYYLIILLPCMFIYFSIFFLNLSLNTNEIVNIQRIQTEINLDLGENKPGYAIYTKGCKIQDFDPTDPAIVKLLDGAFTFVCSKIPSLVILKNNTFIVNPKALSYYEKTLDYCLYVPIFRDGEGHTDDEFKYGNEVSFKNHIVAHDEFVKIECYYETEIIYEELFALVKKKPLVEKKCQELKKQHLANLSAKSSDLISIMFVGIDSVSRLNFLRTCPKTHKYLIENLKAIELKGYNKVGDNTFHNLVPLLLEKYVAELDWNDTLPFDKFSFIWKEYNQKGYRTLFAEDFPEAALFNCDTRGFFYTPADYYLRPFYLALHNSSVLMNSPYPCAGNKMHTDVILDYVYDFAKLFKNDFYFAFSFITSLTHDFQPNSKFGEKSYLNFLKKLKKNKLLNNTVLFFMSDHGIRFGDYRESYFGRLEERLPMAYIVFPSWFFKKYPLLMKIFKRNSKQLTTPFDIYATLKDLLYMPLKRPKYGSIDQRSISLFDVIPKTRTCKDATILPHWCTCQEKIQMSISDMVAVRATYFALSHINGLTEPYRELCEELSLLKTLDAWFNEVNTKLLSYNSLLGYGQNENVYYADRALSSKDITVTFITKPSFAKFEATLRYYERTKKFKMMGDVSRINKYGNQSFCITNHFLKKYCYCGFSLTSSKNSIWY